MRTFSTMPASPLKNWETICISSKPRLYFLMESYLAHDAPQNSTKVGVKWWCLYTFNTFPFSVNSVQLLLSH